MEKVGKNWDERSGRKWKKKKRKKKVGQMEVVSVGWSLHMMKKERSPREVLRDGGGAVFTG